MRLKTILLCFAVSSSVMASSSPSPSSPPPASPAMQAIEALLRPMVPEATRIEVRRVAGLPDDCLPSAVVPLSPVDHSGPVVVDVEDRTGQCRARVVVDVRVERSVLVVSRPIEAQQVLADAVALSWREVSRHQQAVASLPDGAIARRALMAGQLLVADDLATPGPTAGDAVKIVLRRGELRLVRSAVATPCAASTDRRLHCARLPNGRLVHGVFREGVIELTESP
jgi:hypothetical protein